MKRGPKVSETRYRRAPIALLAAVALTVAVSPALAQTKGFKPGPGFVDGTVFLDMVGEDNVRVEVSISRSLIKIITAAHPDLEELAGGLESIHAVIAELNPDTEKRALDAIRSLDRRLASKGWQRVARVRDEGSEVKVLVLDDGEAIEGLVVMVVERDEGEVIFVNIAGRVDPAAIQRIGSGLAIPGLDELDGIDLDDRKGRDEED